MGRSLRYRGGTIVRVPSLSQIIVWYLCRRSVVLSSFIDLCKAFLRDSFPREKSWTTCQQECERINREKEWGDNVECRCG
jgi:hypothetical protein